MAIYCRLCKSMHEIEQDWDPVYTSGRPPGNYCLTCKDSTDNCMCSYWPGELEEPQITYGKRWVRYQLQDEFVPGYELVEMVELAWDGMELVQNPEEEYWSEVDASGVKA